MIYRLKILCFIHCPQFSISMDANANRIEIILKEGGIKMLEIRDNGSGIRVRIALKTYSIWNLTQLSHRKRI